MTRFYKWYDGLKEPYRFLLLLGTVYGINLLPYIDVRLGIITGLFYLYFIITRLKYLQK